MRARNHKTACQAAGKRANAPGNRAKKPPHFAKRFPLAPIAVLDKVTVEPAGHPEKGRAAYPNRAS